MNSVAQRDFFDLDRPDILRIIYMYYYTPRIFNRPPCVQSNIDVVIAVVITFGRLIPQWLAERADVQKRMLRRRVTREF
jgi:hypothetical protein